MIERGKTIVSWFVPWTDKRAFMRMRSSTVLQVTAT